MVIFKNTLVIVTINQFVEGGRVPRYRKEIKVVSTKYIQN